MTKKGPKESGVPGPTENIRRRRLKVQASVGGVRGRQRPVKQKNVKPKLQLLGLLGGLGG